MQWPNLPTDNLYKFVALSGVALVITTNYLVFTMNRELLPELYGIRQQLVELEAKYTNADTRFTDDSTDQLVERVYEFIRDKDSLTLRAEHYDREAGFIRLLSYGALLLIVQGYLMAFWGFWRWHGRVQILQDALLEAELKKVSTAPQRKWVRPSK